MWLAESCAVLYYVKGLIQNPETWQKKFFCNIIVSSSTDYNEHLLHKCKNKTGQDLSTYSKGTDTSQRPFKASLVLHIQMV